jgi:hypothetical protein
MRNSVASGDVDAAATDVVTPVCSLRRRCEICF